MRDRKIDIAIIGAMSEEIETIKQNMLEVNSFSVHGKIFYEGKLENKTFVLTQSGVGKVSATLSVALLNSLYPIKKLIFTGIAGAINPTLNVGDIVVANKLFQHDVDSLSISTQSIFKLYVLRRESLILLI